jgi:rubrerythrin
MAILKKYRVPIVITIVLTLVYFVGVRACDIVDGYSVAIGNYKALAAHAKTETAAKLRENAALLSANAEKDKVIEKKDAEIAGKNESIYRLSEKQVGLEGKLANAKTDAERVPILTGLVETWRDKYAEQADIVKAKDIQIEAWASKYLALEKVSKNYEGLWQDAEGRVVALEKARKALALELKITKLGSKAKTVLVAAAAGYVAYSLIKK